MACSRSWRTLAWMYSSFKFVQSATRRYVRHNTSGRATNHASKKYGLIGQKNSTFFPSLAPDVKMEDDDADNDYDADFYRSNHIKLLPSYYQCNGVVLFSLQQQ